MTVAEKEREKQISGDFKEKIDYDELLNCMRCGFCLPACPTYVETGGNEAASPRGRIALMKAVADGQMEPDKDFENQLSLCLGCRACEPVCPSGVKYGHLLEEARDILEAKKKRPLPVKLFRKWMFQSIFPNQNRVRTLINLLGFYQKSGIQKVARITKLTDIAGKNMSVMEKVLPSIPSPSKLKKRPVHVHAAGGAKKKVGFFSGCLMDTLFMETNDSTLYLLQKANCEVVIPQTQNCCGALHAHSGEKEIAKELAKKNIVAFEQGEFDYIISNAGGCGAILTEYDYLLKHEPEWVERARLFVSKVKDISEVLYETGLPNMEVNPQVVTYQDSCHLRNVMGTASAPRNLLQNIKGVSFIEMKEAERCCGSAGTYNIIEQDMSMQILDHKMKNVESTRATTVVTSNPGCLLQMKLGIEREGKQETMKAVHIVDLLAEAVRNASKTPS